jgi:prepilin-type N-terminal cleavage/methylation domain-containing protein
MKEKNKKGFTLIEMLIVIAIIGILAVMILFSVTNSLKKSRDNKRVTDINQVILNANLYYDKNGSYPSNLNELGPDFLEINNLVDPKDKTKSGASYISYSPLGSPVENCTVTVSTGFELVELARTPASPYTQKCAQ